jgi:hypothetical protein
MMAFRRHDEFPMNEADHAAQCQDVLGAPFLDVHRFLDQFFKLYLGLPHRIILHHRLGAKLAGLLFGDGAEEAAKLHIMADTGKYPIGPEHFSAKGHYQPDRGTESHLAGHLDAMIGYKLDLCAGRTLRRNLRCPCGYRGYFLKTEAGEACPWCRGHGLDLDTRFGILAELTVGYRFRRQPLSAGQVEIVTAGFPRHSRLPSLPQIPASHGLDPRIIPACPSCRSNRVAAYAEKASGVSCDDCGLTIEAQDLRRAIGIWRLAPGARRLRPARIEFCHLTTSGRAAGGTKEKLKRQNLLCAFPC